MHDGHRQRIDEKVRQFGFEGLEEHEQLEQILYAVIPRKNTNHLAHTLLEKYGTLGGVLAADIRELEKIEGVGHRTAAFLTCLPGLLGAVHRSAFNIKKLAAQKELEDYVKTFFYGKLIETAYVFFFNSLDGVIGFEKISEGVASETYIHPQQVVRKAVTSNASKVVIAHNHPCGLSKPSNQDKIVAGQIFTALNAVGIEFRDSIIVAQGECYSMGIHGDYVPDKKKLY